MMDISIVHKKIVADFESSKEDCLLAGDFCKQNLFLQLLNKTIPKKIMTLEEKYIRHCLELIHINSSSKLNFFPAAAADALLLFSSGDENVSSSIVGSITGSTSMINLINSPLLRASEDNNTINYENPSATESLCGGSSQNKSIVSGDRCHQRLVSFSSTNSSSSSNAYCHGMLHCSWNNGFPQYVLSIEDQREVYTTNLLKTHSDYVYMFYSKSRIKENDEESYLVGKMRVSTLSPLGTEIMETEFTLCATGIHTPNQMTVKKSTGLTKKMSSILRGNHSYRQRTFSKFDGSVDSFLQSNKEANLELAAIVVKDHLPCKKVGGWGLKFLKEQKASAEPCEACRHNTDHHSISMDVVIPAGFHGGPRTKHGGPSGLVERWRNGGACDCGGWDIGCPLTVLSYVANNKDVLYQDGVFGKSNRFELFTQGGEAVIQVTNVHDGLYYIHYQSTLSALQSLSIAVAIIHSHSPTLKPKLLYRNT